MLPTDSFTQVYAQAPSAFYQLSRFAGKILYEVRKISVLLVLALWALSPFSAIGQSQITLSGSFPSGTTTRAPIERDFSVTTIRHHWSNLMFTDSVLNTFGFPDFVWIDSIAFFKSGTPHPSQPFALGIWLGQANQTLWNFSPRSWDDVVLNKRSVLVDSLFRLDTTQGEIVFRFQTPYAYWNNGLEVATRSDFGQLPTPPLVGSGSLRWLRAGSDIFGRFATYRGTTNNFNSWEVGETPSALSFPIIKIYYRNRLSRDLGIKSLLSPTFPVVQDSLSVLKVRVINEGTSQLTGAQLSYQIGNGNIVTQSFAFTLSPDSSTELSFAGNIQIPQTGQFQLSVWVNHVNGGLIDSVSTNDTLRRQLTTAITADTVWVGQQQPFTNLQQVINRLNAGGNTKPLTVMLTENQFGNFSWSNFSVPESRRVTISSVNPNIGIQSGVRGPLLRFNNVEGVTVSGLQLRHNFVSDSADYLIVAEGSKRLELASNRLMGSSTNPRNFLVMLRNCDQMTVRNNHFTNGSKGLVSISDAWNNRITQHRVLANQFNNQTLHAIHYYGSSTSDSVLLESNIIHNTLPPLSSGRGIEVYNSTRLRIQRNSITGQIGQYGIMIQLFTGSASQPNSVVNNMVSGNFVYGAGNALYVLGDGIFPTYEPNYIHIDHNSLHARSSATPASGFGPLRIASRVFNVNHWSGHTIRNNLMMLTAPASSTNSAAITASNLLDLTRPGMVISHNHYHVPGHSQVRGQQNGENFATLTAWRDAYPNSELGSGTGNPLVFNQNADNLRPNLNSPLLNAGISIPGILIDLDGNTRDPLPDRGAFEGQPLTNSSHLLRIASPASNALLLADSNYVLSVWVRNTGSNTLNGLRFSHRFGYKDTVRVDWNGNLAPGDSLLFSFPQPLRIRSDSMYVPDLRVWTNTLAGTSSPNALLDTLVGFYCIRIPAGTYLMGSTASNLAPIESWLRLLSCAGIGGPVTLRTDFTNNALVNQIIDLGNISGTSASNTLTLDGQGDTLRMTTSSTQVASIRLNGSKHIQIRNFVIQGAGTNVLTQVWLHNVDTVSIVGNRFLMQPSIETNHSITLGSITNVLQPSRSTALRIDSNHFTGGVERAIYINGNSSNLSRRLQIRHNLIQPSLEGIFVNSADTAWISHNDISMPNGLIGSATARGIYLIGLNGEIHIHHNRVYGFKRTFYNTNSEMRAISILGSSITGKSHWIYNNLIYDIGTRGIQAGITVASTIQGDIAFNTIHLNDTFSTGEAIGMQISSGGNGLRLHGNNIVIDKRQGTFIAALRREGNPIPANFNNYFVRFRGPAHQLIRTNTTSFNTLAAYRQAFPSLDSASSELDAFFENPAAGQYNANALGLYRNAQPLAYVTTDLNNRPRPAIPSRGAIEDTILAQETGFEALLGLSTSACYVSGANTQLATFYNLGSNSIDSVVVRYKRNQGPWLRDTALLNMPGRQQVSYPLGRGNLVLSGNDTVIAVATSHYGSTVRRDTIRITTPNNFRPLLTVPFLNPFENTSSLNNYCVFTNPHSVVQVVGIPLAPPLIGQSSLGMSASSLAQGWVTANASNAWVLNPQYLSEVTFFVNPVRVGPLRMAMRLSMFGSTGHNFFRVLVNDVPIAPQGLSDPTLTFSNIGQQSLLYRLDLINTGAPLKITMQSSVRYAIDHPTRHVNLIDSLTMFFGPNVVFSGLSTFSDTLCAPIARQVQVQALPATGANISGVSLHYSADGGPWNSIPMTTTAVNNYLATLPAIAGAKRIRYTAVALVGTQNWSSDTAEFYIYPFRVELGPNRTVLSGLSTTIRPQFLQSGAKALRITELMYFRSGSSTQATFPPGISTSVDELIEVANYGDDSVDLREAEIAISSTFISLVTYRFPHGAMLPPKGRAVVAVGTGVDNFTDGIYFLNQPINVNQFFLSNQAGALVLREAGSKQPIDGLMINGTVFPTSLSFPAGIWSGRINGSGSSGIKRTNVNAFDSTAWILNTTANPSNIGTIDSTFRVGPTGSQIRWRDFSGQLVGTGDSIVVTPIGNTLLRVEADWYGCTSQDSMTIFWAPNNRVDLAITDIIQPPAVDTFLITAPLATAIRIKNLGNISSGNVLVELIANGGLVASTTVSQGVAANDSLVVTLPTWLPVQGTYDLCFRLTNAADTIAANNVLCRNNIYFATSTSFEDLNGSKLRVYPIPTKNQLFIQLDEGNHGIDHNQWQAIDATGRKVPLRLLSTTDQGMIELETSMLSSGMYFLQNVSNHSIKRVKFVIAE